MQHGTQPNFEPPVMRLPQVPPLKVPARRQTQFIIPPSPSPAPYTEQIPAMPSVPPVPLTRDFIIRVPVTPPITRQQTWVRTPNPAHMSIRAAPVTTFVPTIKRSREAGSGEVLLGCAFLLLAGLLALALLYYLSIAI
ncbi:MAG TPA: hypothetical protein VNE38_16525 [Ktedonobacteraceae bacterium]|nr:hypothetical protein [Ktedonobacteraceae bacterium]